MAIKTNGLLYSTGKNDRGQLGLGDLINRNVFTNIAGDWLIDPSSITLYGHANLPRFGGGYGHALSITTSEALNSTGHNLRGQLAIGTSGILTDRDEFDSISASIPIRETADKWEYVVCGQYHTMALKNV